MGRRGSSMYSPSLKTGIVSMKCWWLKDAKWRQVAGLHESSRKSSKEWWWDIKVPPTRNKSSGIQTCQNITIIWKAYCNIAFNLPLLHELRISWWSHIRVSHYPNVQMLMKPFARWHAVEWRSNHLMRYLTSGCPKHIRIKAQMLTNTV